jgi:2-aminoadipate transaminase
VRAVLDEHGSTSLQYGGGQGHLSLRTRLSMLMAAEGVAGDPEDMIVTSGAQQALDLIGKIFLDAGDLIAVEAPAYVGALTAFGAYEPRYLQIDVDDDGMVVDQLEESLVRGDRPKLVYTCPNFGNPTGMTLSYGRREQLVVLCREAGIPIVEDNPYGMLRFEGDQLLALRTLDPDNVIYIGTVSKVFSPGVRVGWALAGQSVVPSGPREGSGRSLRFNIHDARHRAVLRRRGPLENQPRDAERDLPITTRRDARSHRGALST